MIVRFEEDEYIAVAIFDAGNRVQTMEAMDEIFSYLDEDMKLLIFTTIQDRKSTRLNSSHVR